jgi:hypothetical protein
MGPVDAAGVYAGEIPTLVELQPIPARRLSPRGGKFLTCPGVDEAPRTASYPAAGPAEVSFAGISPWDR